MAAQKGTKNTLKHTPVNYGRVALFGLGVSGIAAARYLLDLLGTRVAEMTIYGGDSKNERAQSFAKELKNTNIRILFDTEDIAETYDYGIISPGIAETSSFYLNAKKACAQLISEPDLAFLESPEDWIAITGTNGKTTTTTLIAHLLETAGIHAYAIGNIGDPCIGAVKNRKPGEVFVVELSSFQIASSPHISPRVAVLLNITPDHVAWHGTLERYAQVKLSLFDNLDKKTKAVCCIDDPSCRELATTLKIRGIDVQEVTVSHAELLPLPQDECMLKGTHNLTNMLAAVSAVEPYVSDPEILIRGLKTFSPLLHRLEPCGSINGVLCFNDSKATNVDSALQALSAFGEAPLIMLLGGHDKGTDLEDFAVAVANRCKAVVCFGEAKERFASAFENKPCILLRAQSLEPALDAALEIAKEGDVIALSPACSSFDEFKSFEHRGDVFKKLVALRAASSGKED